MIGRAFLSVKFEGHSNRASVEVVERALIRKGWRVFLPVRDVSEWGARNIDYSEMMRKVLRGLYDSDILVADVSKRGHGIAAEIGMAFALNKPICLFRVGGEGDVSESLIGMASSFLQAEDYVEASELIAAETGKLS